MFATLLETMTCYHPHDTGHDSISCTPPTMDTTSTQGSDLGGITVCRARHILFLHRVYVIIDCQFVTVGLANFWFSRFIPLMKTDFKVLRVISSNGRKMPRTKRYMEVVLTSMSWTVSLTTPSHTRTPKSPMRTWGSITISRCSGFLFPVRESAAFQG